LICQILEGTQRNIIPDRQSKSEDQQQQQKQQQQQQQQQQQHNHHHHHHHHHQQLRTEPAVAGQCECQHNRLALTHASEPHLPCVRGLRFACQQRRNSFTEQAIQQHTCRRKSKKLVIGIEELNFRESYFQCFALPRRPRGRDGNFNDENRCVA
jgi:hypothetical protein